MFLFPSPIIHGESKCLLSSVLGVIVTGVPKTDDKGILCYRRNIRTLALLYLKL